MIMSFLVDGRAIRVSGWRVRAGDDYADREEIPVPDLVCEGQQVLCPELLPTTCCSSD